MAKHRRLSRLHRDLVEEHFDSEFRKDIFDEIVLPHRYAAGHEQDIVLQAATDFFAKIVEIVPANPKNDRLGAGLLNLCANRVGVAVSNLSGFGRLMRLRPVHRPSR